MSNKDPVRIGVLFSETGVTSTIGKSQLQGTLLAIDEVNEAGGIDGRMLVPVRYDAQSSPPLYAQLAERLIVQDKVDVIFGCYMSSSRKAVIPIVERWNKILFYPTLYEGFEYSNNVIYTGAAPNQNSVQLAEFMTSNFGSRVYLIGSDYIYPYESNRIMSELILQRAGGEKLAERYVQLDANEKDFDPKTMPIASLTTSEAEVSEMGRGVATGHFTSAPYFQTIDSDLNRRCLERFRQRVGGDCVPNLCWEAAYFQLHIFAEAFRDAGSGDIQALMPSLLGREFDAPQGRVKIDANNHHTWVHPRIGRVDENGQFTIIRAATRAVQPDPYLVTHLLADWAMKLSIPEL